MNLQAIAGILVGGALIAAIVSRESVSQFLTTFLIGSVALGGLWLVFTRWLFGSSARSRAGAIDDMKRRDAQIFALPLEEARARAEALLADEKKFDRGASPVGNAAAMATLSPTLRDFFARHEKVRTRHGDTVLDRALVGPSELNPRYTRIGRDADLTELVTLPGGDAVFEIDGSEVSEAQMRRYPSVYHLIVSVCDTIYPDGARPSSGP